MTDDVPPPHDPVAAEKAMAQAMACGDHDFGEDGLQPHCTKCGMEFQLANRIGKAHHRRVQRARAQTVDDVPIV